MTRRITHHQQPARTETSRHLKWALEQVEENHADDREDLGRQLDYIDDAMEMPDVLVSARSRRMF